MESWRALIYEEQDTHSSEQIKARQRWIGLLARADENYATQLWDSLKFSPQYQIIKPAEQGLVMVRGRAGGSGHPFNLGEMTVTRCSVRLENDTVGHAYIQGCKSDYAERAAVIDALMQDEQYNRVLETKLISELEKQETERRNTKSKKAAATKVDFFTMVRGED